MTSERLKQFLNDSSWSLTGVAIGLILENVIVAIGIGMAIACYAVLSSRDGWG